MGWVGFAGDRGAERLVLSTYSAYYLWVGFAGEKEELNRAEGGPRMGRGGAKICGDADVTAGDWKARLTVERGGGGRGEWNRIYVRIPVWGL